MKKNILKIGVLLIGLFLGIIKVDAASFTISASTTSPIKGNNVTLTIKGTDVTGRFNITSSNSSILSISEDRAWIENNSYSIKLNALNTGTATITVTPSGVSDSSGNTVNLASKTISITVSLPREKSNDNNLKSLELEGFEITPEFDKNIQVYSSIVPEGTTSVKINAIANESHASVSGLGELEVTNGMNIANIVVKSETGVEKIYTINIEVKDNNPISVNVDNKDFTLIKLKENLIKPENFEEAEVTIDGYNIPAFKNELTSITLVGLKDLDGNVELYIYEKGKYKKYNEMNLKTYMLIPTKLESTLELSKTTVKINEEEIEAYVFDKEENYVIISAINLEDGKTSFYLYDIKNKAAIKYSDLLSTDEEEDTIKSYSYVIIAFGSALVFSLIIIFSLLHSLKKKQKKIDKFVKKQEAKIEATRKLNDVVDEVKKITEEEKKEVKNNELDGLTSLLETFSEEQLQTTNQNQNKYDKRKKYNHQNHKKNKIQKEDDKEEIKIEKIEIENKPVINSLHDDSDEVYDLFEDDRKKKKNKHR